MCISLLWPFHATAGPAPLPDWGVADTPTAKPAPTKAAEPEIVMVDDAAPAKRSKRGSQSRKPKKEKVKKTEAAPATETPASVARADQERQPIQVHARNLESTGQTEEAARSLVVGAEAYGDPILHLDAAALYLQLAQARGRAGVADSDRCIRHAQAAVAALPADDTTDPRVDPNTIDTLTRRSDELIRQAEKHKSHQSARRNGHQEVIAGSVLLTAGLASVGVMAGGLYLNGVSGRELARGEGRPDEELAPLRAQERRSETMIAAGAVAGAVGVALGIALVAIGARDLKAARVNSSQARIRVAPSFGGLVVAGHF